jgi:LPXTG-motif cell wall-anchored protein
MFVLYVIMFVALGGGFVLVRRKRKGQPSAAN